MTRSMAPASSAEAPASSTDSADAEVTAASQPVDAPHEARVLLVHLDMHSANLGQTLVLAAALRAENWDAQIVCRKSAWLAFAAQQHDVPVHALPDEGEKSLGMAWKLLRAIHNKKNTTGKATLVHACDLAASHLVSLAWRLSKKFRIVHTRRIPIMEPNTKAMLCYQRPQAKIITDSLAGEIALRLSGLDQHMLRTIPCCLETSSHPQRTHAVEERFIFAITGDLTPLKGHSFLFDAMLHLDADTAMMPWEVRVLGSGPLFSSLLEEAQHKNVASRLAFLTGLDTAAELCRCDALVLPASEGESYLPLILHGWASGLPIITSNRLDHAEFLRHEANCLLTQSGSTAELAEQMARLTRDPALHAQLVEGGKASLQRFCLQRTVTEHRRLYREILA